MWDNFFTAKPKTFKRTIFGLVRNTISSISNPYWANAKSCTVKVIFLVSKYIFLCLWTLLNLLLQHDTEREWIVSVLRDGIRDDLSYSLMQQSFVFKMLQGFHDSSMATLVGLERGEENSSLENDSQTKALILEVIRRSVKLPKAAFDLVINFTAIRQVVERWVF